MSGRMLKLVESLAVKAQRAKSTTVEFIPLRETTTIHECDWCGTVGSGKRKGWNSYTALERSARGEFPVTGDVCPNAECRISLQAKYS
jgi:hypothetical protein